MVNTGDGYKDVKKIRLLVAMIAALLFVPQLVPATAHAQGLFDGIFGGGGNGSSANSGNSCSTTKTQLIACERSGTKASVSAIK